MNKRILTDHFHYQDEILNHSTAHPRTLWARTQIIGGYGKRTNKLGVSSLDEVIFETENMVPLIGVQYAMEMIFGVKGTQLVIPTLNDTMGIGAQGKLDLVPSGSMPYVYGQKVCLFGIGKGGAAENNLTALEVKYHETEISDMIPFRYTKEELPDADKTKYFGKKTDSEGYDAYYLKAFDNEPIIRHLFKNGEENEDGSEVTNDFFNGNSQYGIQSFTECCLTISRRDIREFFKAQGDIEVARVNSIGLFTAVYDEESHDYAQIQLFSKLNIPTEPMSLSKDMNIIYRVYGA